MPKDLLLETEFTVTFGRRHWPCRKWRNSCFWMTSHAPRRPSLQWRWSTHHRSDQDHCSADDQRTPNIKQRIRTQRCSRKFTDFWLTIQKFADAELTCFPTNTDSVVECTAKWRLSNLVQTDQWSGDSEKSKWFIMCSHLTLDDVNFSVTRSCRRAVWTCWKHNVSLLWGRAVRTLTDYTIHQKPSAFLQNDQYIARNRNFLTWKQFLVWMAWCDSSQTAIL